MKKGKKKLAAGLTAAAVVLASASMTGCGGDKKTASSENFTFWLYNAVDSGFYETYADNPSLKYALSKTYGPDDTSLSFEFWVPASGTATDNFSTMLGSGDYSDIIENTIGEAPITYYREGVTLDLTDYVKEYMPNYQAFIEEHPEVKEYAVTDVDGEEKYLGIVSFYDVPDDCWCGHCYRRDWIVKYGTNPQTGEPFTGGYTDENDPDSWEDDVVFPSGGTDPVYISDWEWMFQIFETAMEDQGITDGYCISIPYSGMYGNGLLEGAFGGGAGYWYRNSDNEVIFGPGTEQFRAYLTCMNNWYEKGWLDQTFNERTSDMFYMINSTAVYQGKVGCWMGLTSQLGGRMDSGDELTDGIYVAGAAIPINDVYGGEESQNIEPYCSMNGNLVNTTYLVTTAAEDKDIAALCSFFDYFYSEEGAVLRTAGLNAEQAAEVDSEFLDNYDMKDGSYVVQDDGTYKLTGQAADNDDVAGAAICNKIPGVELISKLDKGYADTLQSSIDLWGKYPDTGEVRSAHFISCMSDEDTDTYTNGVSRVNDYLTENMVKFIQGTLDISSDEDWGTWCKMLTKYGVDSLTELLQSYADQYPLEQ